MSTTNLPDPIGGVTFEEATAADAIDFDGVPAKVLYVAVLDGHRFPVIETVTR